MQIKRHLGTTLQTVALYLWEFLLLEIFCHRRIKVRCISLIDTVDIAFFLDFYVLVDQNEFPNCLAGREKKRQHGHFRAYIFIPK